jgi:formate--tetrahydrofolate ligase
VVAINRYGSDHEDELAEVHAFCAARGVASATADVFGQGGEGARELAALVVNAAAQQSPALPALYAKEATMEEKLHAIATKIYGADGVNLTVEAKAKLELLERAGLGHLPPCMAKTQNSLSDQLTALGRPTGFRITVRDFEIANGAGFIVALCGTLVRMPALPKVPAAERIRVDASGKISGI